jgi:hypothetical protein
MGVYSMEHALKDFPLSAFVPCDVGLSSSGFGEYVGKVCSIVQSTGIFF